MPNNMGPKPTAPMCIKHGMRPPTLRPHLHTLTRVASQRKQEIIYSTIRPSLNHKPGSTLKPNMLMPKGRVTQAVMRVSR